MRLNKVINIITDIENSVSVNQIKLKNIKVWPLIRLEIWKQLTNSPKKRGDEYRKSKETKKIGKTSKILNCLKFLFFKKNKTYTHKNIVFLPITNNRWEKINGKYFRPFSNSLQDILKEEKIDSVIFDYSQKTFYPLSGNSCPIQQEIKKAYIKQKVLKTFIRNLNLNRESNKIYHWNKLVDFINIKYPFLTLSKKNIIKQTNNIFFYEKIFKKIFKKIKPKICFLVCYYNSMNMGCIKACKALGIKSVEIQHGQQGDFHGMYTHWTKLPKNGYELLPTHWWSWGSKSAKRINKWSRTIHHKHHAIVGGNPWIAKNINNDYKIDDVYIDKLNNKLPPNGKINVLVALQPIQPPINNTLIKTITNSPTNINWLIRLHPAMMGQREEVEKLLNKTKNKNFEIDCSSKTPLFNILKKVDFLITPWSSIAYEALLFKVHPIIIHLNGKDAFTEYINNNLFTYADSPQKIIKTIKINKNHFNFVEEKPYIETSLPKIKDSLLNLIEE